MGFKFTTLPTLLLCLAVCGSVQAQQFSHPVTPSLVDVPDNTWVKVDTGGLTAPPNITSYSGGWYDPEYHQLCVFGGGHWDYSGNEVWCFNIATLAWRELYPPDVVTEQGGPNGAYNNFDNSRYPGALFNPAGESIANANPMSKHTYDQMEYVAGLGVVVWGGYSWSDSSTGWCQNCPDTWAFNFPSADWTYLYDGTNPSPNRTAGVGTSAFSQTDGQLYVVSEGETWTFNPGSRDWTNINVGGQVPGSIEATMEYDSNRNALYFFGGRYPDNTSLYQFDIASATWTRLNPSAAGPGAAATRGPGLAFDSKNDVLLVYRVGTVWAYHPTSNAWETLSPSERPGGSDYIFGRFRYDPINNGAWLIQWEGGRSATWFYRYRNVSATDPPPLNLPPPRLNVR